METKYVTIEHKRYIVLSLNIHLFDWLMWLSKYILSIKRVKKIVYL